MIRYGLELIGHRGVAGRAPENTLAGLRSAAGCGLTHAEVDARLTSDGNVILLHDASLERTTNGSGLASQATTAEIAFLDAGGWFSPAFAGEPVPTLAQALDLAECLGLTLNVEIKAESSFDARRSGRTIARLVAAHRSSTGVYISCFWQEALKAASEVAPSIGRALLIGAITRDWRARATDVGVNAVHAAAEKLIATSAVAVVEAGYLLRCYTVNDADTARRLAHLGASAIFTNDPDWIDA